MYTRGCILWAGNDHEIIKKHKIISFTLRPSERFQAVSPAGMAPGDGHQARSKGPRTGLPGILRAQAWKACIVVRIGRLVCFGEYRRGCITYRTDPVRVRSCGWEGASCHMNRSRRRHNPPDGPSSPAKRPTKARDARSVHGPAGHVARTTGVPPAGHSQANAAAP